MEPGGTRTVAFGGMPEAGAAASGIDHPDERSRRLEVRTDPEILIRILENLMLNAMQAGASRVQVDVKNSDGGGVEISVRDDGPGIPETLLPDGLFEPFRTTKAQGTGVGLWQAKRLAVALGGDLKAGNEAEGGAVFHLSLAS
jgi:signal transduction histidine kinase